MNYTEIVNAAKMYADRNDLEVSDNIDTFIIMAESRMNRLLLTYEQTHRIQTSTRSDQEYYSLPDEYNGMRSITYTSESGVEVNIDYVTPEFINNYDTTSGKYVYTIINQQIQISPRLGAAGILEIVFYRKVGNLNKTNPVNWCSISNPDIYICGIICEIETFVKNYDVAKMWDSRMERGIKELVDIDIDKRWTGTTLTIRT